METAHIINVPQIKGHGGSSITPGLKNNFGSIYINNAQWNISPHQYFYQGGISYGGTACNMPADTSANAVFKNKTWLIIGDGLMGNCMINWQDPVLWKTFDNNPPEIIFFGVITVAADSVMFDYLQAAINAISQSAGKRNSSLYCGHRPGHS